MGKKRLDIYNERIRNLYLSGFSSGDIAKRIGCSKSAVAKRIKAIREEKKDK